MGSVRFLKNMNLQVEFDGQETLVPFASGSVHPVDYIQKNEFGYCNIIMPDGSVIPGVAQEVFRAFGNVRIEKLEEETNIVNNEEIVVEDVVEAPALLDGTMLGAKDGEEIDAEPTS